MKRMFISYNRENLEWAKSLAEDLTALGHEPWFDQDLAGGQAWWDQILKQIRQCDAFVIGLTPESLESTACRRESTYALALGKSILPIMAGASISGDLLPPHLAQLHYLDYQESDKAAVMRLAKAVNTLSPSPPVPDPLPPPPDVPISILSSLRQQIESSALLTFEDQTAILVKARQALRDGKKPDDVHALLAAFRRRDDLLARVADEIDEMVQRSVAGGRLPRPTGAASPVPPHHSGAAPAATPDVTASGKENLPPASPMLRGLDELVNRVRLCFGPVVRTVILSRGTGEPVVTSSATHVLEKFTATNPIEAVGVQMVQSAALKVFDAAGTGAATSALLAHSIYRDGLEALAAQSNPTRLTKSLEAATAACVEQLKTLAQPIDQKTLKAVARMTAGPGLDWVVAGAFDKVGLEGPVFVEDHLGRDTLLDVVDGMEFDRGVLSGYFLTDTERNETVLEKPLILFHHKRINSARELSPLLDRARRAGRSLLIVADDVEGDALETLVDLNQRAALRAVAVKAPGFGDRRTRLLEDMAILTAGQVVTEKSGLELETIGLENLGSARKVLVTQETTILVEGAGNRAAIDARIRDIRAEIGNVTSDYDRDKLEDRLTRLTNGVALIRVGASTASNRQYERTLIDTGIRAVRAAIEEGIVPGGGVALLHAAERVANDTANAEMQPGLGIIRRACEQPLRQLAVNGGGDPEAVVAEILKANSPGFGFNVENGKLTDLLTADIVDPSKAARYALQNATSAAVGLLWSSVAT